MSEPTPTQQTPRKRGRRAMLIVGCALAAAAAGVATVTVVGSLAIADQGGTPMGVPGVYVDAGTSTVAPPPSAGTPPADPSPAASPTATPATTSPASSGDAGAEPALVPAPTPVAVDDHGGDRSTNDTSGSGGSGSGSTRGGDG